jgi:hypothetical protein
MADNQVLMAEITEAAASACVHIAKSNHQSDHEELLRALKLFNQGEAFVVIEAKEVRTPFISLDPSTRQRLTSLLEEVNQLIEWNGNSSQNTPCLRQFTPKELDWLMRLIIKFSIPVCVLVTPSASNKAGFTVRLYDHDMALKNQVLKAVKEKTWMNFFTHEALAKREPEEDNDAYVIRCYRLFIEALKPTEAYKQVCSFYRLSALPENGERFCLQRSS